MWSLDFMEYQLWLAIGMGWCVGEMGLKFGSLALDDECAIEMNAAPYSKLVVVSLSL